MKLLIASLLIAISYAQTECAFAFENAGTRIDKWEYDYEACNGRLPNVWSGMEDVQEIHLDDTEIIGTLPDSWSIMTSLEKLHLQYNEISGKIPASWSGMTSIERFYLHYNQLTGTLPESFSALTTLERIYIINNALSGTLPESWSSMTDLKYLFLYDNEMTGTLPQSWSRMSSLTSLSLYSNDLSGTLPSSWSAITSLRFLDLRNNDLIGTFPSDWARLSDMQDLDLRNNYLDPTTMSQPDTWTVIADADFKVLPQKLSNDPTGDPTYGIEDPTLEPTEDYITCGTLSAQFTLGGSSDSLNGLYRWYESGGFFLHRNYHAAIQHCEWDEVGGEAWIWTTNLISPCNQDPLVVSVGSADHTTLWSLKPLVKLADWVEDSIAEIFCYEIEDGLDPTLDPTSDPSLEPSLGITDSPTAATTRIPSDNSDLVDNVICNYFRAELTDDSSILNGWYRWYESDHVFIHVGYTAVIKYCDDDFFESTWVWTANLITPCESSALAVSESEGDEGHGELKNWDPLVFNQGSWAVDHEANLLCGDENLCDLVYVKLSDSNLLLDGWYHWIEDSTQFISAEGVAIQYCGNTERWGVAWYWTRNVGNPCGSDPEAVTPGIDLHMAIMDEPPLIAETNWARDEGATIICRTGLEEPSTSPTLHPTDAPHVPTVNPTHDPTPIPTTKDPTLDPTACPTSQPSLNPTLDPTVEPTTQPSSDPTVEPTVKPTNDPTVCPTSRPTSDPTTDPTFDPTKVPTTRPSSDPTMFPTSGPTADPTTDPTIDPTEVPSNAPSFRPSNIPTRQPSSYPTSDPTSGPSMDPTLIPTCAPTVDPTQSPTNVPTFHPTADPTQDPTETPTRSPTTSNPTITPSNLPSDSPIIGTKSPTTPAPSVSPTTPLPSKYPTLQPSNQPSFSPTLNPTFSPSINPSRLPTLEPTPERCWELHLAMQVGKSCSMNERSFVEEIGLSECKQEAINLDHPYILWQSPATRNQERPMCHIYGSCDGLRTPEVTGSSYFLTTCTDFHAYVWLMFDGITDRNWNSVQPLIEKAVRHHLGVSENEMKMSVAFSRRRRLGEQEVEAQIKTYSGDMLSDLESSISDSTFYDWKGAIDAEFTDSGLSVELTSVNGVREPTEFPSVKPSTSPTLSPTPQPTTFPTNSPSRRPTKTPTNMPSSPPTTSPSTRPTTTNPTTNPSPSPTPRPTSAPSHQPTTSPTSHPTPRPTGRPTTSPSSQPTTSPSMRPTPSPVEQPTLRPNDETPTRRPSPSQVEVRTEEASTGGDTAMFMILIVCVATLCLLCCAVFIYFYSRRRAFDEADYFYQKESDMPKPRTGIRELNLQADDADMSSQVLTTSYREPSYHDDSYYEVSAGSSKRRIDGRTHPARMRTVSQTPEVHRVPEAGAFRRGPEAFLIDPYKAPENKTPKPATYSPYGSRRTSRQEEYSLRFFAPNDRVLVYDAVQNTWIEGVVLSRHKGTYNVKIGAASRLCERHELKDPLEFAGKLVDAVPANRLKQMAPKVAGHINERSYYSERSVGAYDMEYDSEISELACGTLHSNNSYTPYNIPNTIPSNKRLPGINEREGDDRIAPYGMQSYNSAYSGSRSSSHTRSVVSALSRTNSRRGSRVIHQRKIYPPSDGANSRRGSHVLHQMGHPIDTYVDDSYVLGTSEVFGPSGAAFTEVFGSSEI